MLPRPVALLLFPTCAVVHGVKVKLRGVPGLRKERDTGRAVCARQGRTGGRRTGLIERLLNAANKQSEKTKAEGTPVKEAAPAK